MVRALLDGSKTQTRRVVKIPPPAAPDDAGRYPHYYGTVGQYSGAVVERHFWSNYPDAETANAADQELLLWPSKDVWSDEPAEHGLYGSGGMECPYGQRGDRLWTREAWRVKHWSEDGSVAVEYRAGGSESFDVEGNVFDAICEKYTDLALKLGGVTDDESGMIEMLPGVEFPWVPSIHMPRWASRLTLEIVGVRVERLQAISEADVRAEGVTWHAALTAREAWRALWEQINGKGSWDLNPWVFVIEFKRVMP